MNSTSHQQNIILFDNCISVRYRLHSEGSTSGVGGLHNSGYTTPSNMTNTSVTTQATSLSSQASSSTGGSAPSSNSTSPVLAGATGAAPAPQDSPTHVKNLSVNIPHKSEPVKTQLPQLPNSPYRGGVGGGYLLQQQQQPAYSTLRHYHVGQQRTQSPQAILPNPNVGIMTMPRGGVHYAGVQRRENGGGSSTLSRQPSTASSSQSPYQSPVKLVGTAMTNGSTLQKPKRMYI